ncbi:uncharacterized protein LOC142620050 [Castanea sativa]|uniref:uncharacterized protein LOC142620050 n=1 Tax=Castanea sativa TaxID=21020 RepID=UPI003F651623
MAILTSKREETWTLLESIRSSNALPWLCLGDFNEIICCTEKASGSLRPTRQMDQFRTAISRYGFVDLGHTGSPFTWSQNHSTEGRIHIHLDQALATAAWKRNFLGTVHHLLMSTSNHSMLATCLPTLKPSQKLCHPPFCFVAMWLKDPRCAKVVEESWMEGLYRLGGAQISNCLNSAHLSAWNKPEFGHMRRQIKWLEVTLQSLEQHPQQNYAKIHEEDDQVMERIILNYFTSIFQTNGTMDTIAVIEAIKLIVTGPMNEYLYQSFQAEEVHKALKQMHPKKSLGPDGMPPLFYQHFWSLSGDCVTNAVLDFLNLGITPPNFNGTYIVLIPKVKNPTKITQYRPISLSNVISRLASKVLANRLKCFLPNIVNENQSAFMSPRLITNNVLVAFETMHYLNNKRNGRQGEMALKLDMSKAFDRVEWGYLRDVMLKMGFSDRWVKIMMRCVTSVTYSIQINGTNDDYSCLEQILVTYEKASGQQLNREKTSLFFSHNTPQEPKEYIQHLFGADVIKQHETYLGLPSLVGKSKKNTFHALKEKLDNKLSGWKEKMFSQAGKEILIKAVAQAIPTYTMSVFKLPDTLCDELTSMGRRLQTNTHSLVYHVIKARYFPNSDFLHAKLGRQPSYAWRSLMATQHIVDAGHCWQVGDGTTIRVWRDRWIPQPSTFRAITLPKTLHIDSTVSELIDDETGEWKAALIKQIFLPSEA